MASRRHWPSGPQALTLAQQMGAVSAAWPGFTYRIERNALVIRGLVRPTPICREYQVRIEYPLERAPRVHVDAPALRPREPGGKIPHVYRRSRPCLYLPKAHEWNSSMAIADTIVPWLYLWLFHYEMWHATGEWLGGGKHPRRRSGQRT